MSKTDKPRRQIARWSSRMHQRPSSTLSTKPVLMASINIPWKREHLILRMLLMMHGIWWIILTSSCAIGISLIISRFSADWNCTSTEQSMMISALPSNNSKTIPTKEAITLIWKRSICNTVGTCWSAALAHPMYQPTCKACGLHTCSHPGEATIPWTSTWKRTTGLPRWPISRRWPSRCGDSWKGWQKTGNTAPRTIMASTEDGAAATIATSGRWRIL